MHSTATVAKTMGTAGAIMKTMNASMDVASVAKTMQDFERETAHMDMTEEMISDSLDSLMDDDGTEAQTDDIVSQVLDEIGVEVSGKMASVPRKGLVREAEADGEADADAALLARMQALKTPS